MKHTIRFYYDVRGYVSTCGQHAYANEGTAGRLRWPAETFDGTAAQAIAYVAKVRAEWFGGVIGVITPAV